MGTMAEAFNAAAHFVDRHLAEGRGARVAHRAGGRALTWADVADAADRCGNALAELGVEIENRVLLVLDDGPAFVSAFWGTVKLGAVAVPVNPLMTADDYAFLLEDSRAKVAVVEPAVAPKILAARERCPFLRAVIVAGPQLDDLLARAKPTLAPAPTNADDIMYWGYTSGSTGRP